MDKLKKSAVVLGVLFILLAAMLTVRPALSYVLHDYLIWLHADPVIATRASLVLEIYSTSLAAAALLGRVVYAVWTTDPQSRHAVLTNRGAMLGLLLSALLFLVIDSKVDGLRLSLTGDSLAPLAWNIVARSWIESWVCLGIMHLSFSRDDGTKAFWEPSPYTTLLFAGIVVIWHAMVLIF